MSWESERGGGEVLWGGDGAAGSALPGPIASALLQLTHPRIPMCTKRTSFLLDQYCSPDCREESNRSLEKFALAAQKQTNKQASKQANKTQYLPLNSICCLYFMEELIKKYALGFGDPSFCSKRASFPVCGCFILGHHRKSLCSHPQKFWIKKDSWLLFSFPYETVAIIKGWIFLDVSPYSKKPRVPSFKSSKV